MKDLKKFFIEEQGFKILTGISIAFGVILPIFLLALSMRLFDGINLFYKEIFLPFWGQKLLFVTEINFPFYILALLNLLISCFLLIPSFLKETKLLILKILIILLILIWIGLPIIIPIISDLIPEVS